jgi:hypothetical protein
MTRAVLFALLIGGCVETGELFGTRPDHQDLMLAATGILQGDDWFGSTLVGLGDIDGDGRDDLALVGARSVWIRYGQPLPTGLVDFVPDVVLSADVSPEWTCTGDAHSCPVQFLVPVGDLDGDGLADFVVADHIADAPTYVFYGRRSRLSSGALGEVADAVLVTSTPPSDSSTQPTFDELRPVAAGDLDGDGRSDLLLARVVGDGGTFESEIMYGRRWNGRVIRVPDAIRRYNGHDGAVSGIGDFDGDGFADLAFAADSGRTHVLWGSATRLGNDRAWTEEATMLADYPPAGAYASLVSLGDLDGDGASDLAISASPETTQLVYGGWRPVAAEVSTLPGARLVERPQLASTVRGAPIAGRLPIGHPRAVVIPSTQVSPQQLYIVPHGATRLDGVIDLESQPSYVGTPRTYQQSCGDGCVESQVTAAASVPVIADQDGDGSPELYVGAPTIASPLPGWVYVVAE